MKNEVSFSPRHTFLCSSLNSLIHFLENGVKCEKHTSGTTDLYLHVGVQFAYMYL